MWVTPITICQNFQCQHQTYSVTDSLFIYWIESAKKQDTHHLTETSAACGRTKQPRQPHLLLMLGHTLLWDCILFVNHYLWQGSQCGCVGYSGRTNTLHADATSIQLRWQQDCWHALHTYILDLVSDKLHSVWVKPLVDRDCSQTVEIWIATGYRHSSWYLAPLRLPVMRSFVFHWGRCCSSPSHCLHQKLSPYRCINQHRVLHILSILWHLTLWANCSKHNLDSLLNVIFLYIQGSLAPIINTKWN